MCCKTAVVSLAIMERHNTLTVFLASLYASVENSMFMIICVFFDTPCTTPSEQDFYDPHFYRNR